jgi:hypothetical protein
LSDIPLGYYPPSELLFFHRLLDLGETNFNLGLQALTASCRMRAVTINGAENCAEVGVWDEGLKTV